MPLLALQHTVPFLPHANPIVPLCSCCHSNKGKPCSLLPRPFTTTEGNPAASAFYNCGRKPCSLSLIPLLKETLKLKPFTTAEGNPAA